MASNPSVSKLQSLTTSTLSLLLERSRLISLSLPSSHTLILKNLNTLYRGISAKEEELALELSGLKVGLSSPSAGSSADKDEVKKLWIGLDKLVQVMEEDSEGRRIVGPLKDQIGAKRASIAAAEEQAAQQNSMNQVSLSPPQSQSSLPLPHLPRTSHNGGPLRSRSEIDLEAQRSQVPYRDESSAPVDRRDDGQIISEQMEMMNEQDSRLEILSGSINRQHTLSMHINSELELHHGLLEETETAIDRTQAKLSGARKRLDGFAAKAKQNGSAVTIIVLIVLLAILILLFKT